MDILWVEAERPQTVRDCILPERLKQPFQSYVDKGEIPNLLLCGSPGAGKTTIAKAMCQEVGCDFMFIKGSEENGIDTLRTKINSYASSVSLSGGRKVIIIDEADWMNANSLQPALRSAIEAFSQNCSFILTCNYKNRIMKELHSRFAVVDFKLNKDEKAKMAGQFFKRVLQILDNRNVTYEKEVVAAVVQKYFPDYRRTLNELQRYSQLGAIDTGILAQVSDVSLSEMVSHLKTKDYGKIDKWVKENPDLDTTTFFRNLYDFSMDKLKPESIPQMILILAKYQYQSAFVVDQTINTLACLVEILCDCNFR